MQAKQRSLEEAVFRPSKARRVSESSLSARSRARTALLGGRLGPLALADSPRKSPSTSLGHQDAPLTCHLLSHPPRASLSVGRTRWCSGLVGRGV